MYSSCRLSIAVRPELDTLRSQDAHRELGHVPRRRRGGEANRTQIHKPSQLDSDLVV